MPRLRSLTGGEVIKLLHQLGFETRRITGSHHQLKIQTDERTCNTTVPVHGKTPLASGTLKSILAQISPCVEAGDLSRFYA
ncbi:MAG: type II toxin-antitoxin system HicA family toxin [Phototrophicaceae bacterium]|jgi:predicted RNA binding protein YcfA (HicA-like mRNA interferase family)